MELKGKKSKYGLKLEVLIACLGIWILLLCASNASAQVDDVLVVRHKAKTTIRPKAKPAPRKVDITRRVSIVRVDRKSRTTYRKRAASRRTNRRTPARPVARTVLVPLLAAQLRLLTVDADGNESEVNPLAAFTPNDRLRLSIKTNQRGYLYIIRQPSPEADGEIIFPTTLVNNGSNYVAANTEYILPRNCPKEQVPDPGDCALTLAAHDEAPLEYFTLIFTRDSLVDLPNDLKNSRVSLMNLMSAGRIGAQTLIDLIEESGQDLVSQPGDTPYAIRVVNINPKDNEEIIETFVLSKIKK